MSIMCIEIIFHHTPMFFLRLENVVTPNYNKSSKLTFTQKIEKHLSMHVSACLEASISKVYVFIVQRLQVYVGVESL